MIPCDRRSTVVRLSFHRRSTVGRPSGDCRATVGKNGKGTGNRIMEERGKKNTSQRAWEMGLKTQHGQERDKKKYAPKSMGNGVKNTTWAGKEQKKEPVSRRALPKKHYLLNNTIKKKH